MSLLQAFLMAKLMGGSGGGTTGDITDVQVNGTSIVSGGVANVPVATTNRYGAVRPGNQYGAQSYGSGSTQLLGVFPALDNEMKTGTEVYHTIGPSRQHMAAFYGLSKAAGADLRNVNNVTIGTYPETAKSAISTMLHAPETVTGTTPAITALPGVRYICGEVSTLDITTPASGIVDVVFESGSTPTVLTITPPTGVTVKWAGGFDPASLDANTVYEINICDGLGVAASWT